MVLEQDHRRLAKGHEMKSAADAELHDWHQNERWEDFFMIKGLALLPSAGISSKEWQDRAVKDVQKVLQIVMGAEVPIVYVLNATNKLRDTVATYHVQVAEVSLSKAIRLRFSGYFQGKEDLRPEPLKKISKKQDHPGDPRSHLDLPSFRSVLRQVQLRGPLQGARLSSTSSAEDHPCFRCQGSQDQVLHLHGGCEATSVRLPSPRP